MTELKVASKKYNDEDVLEVENLSDEVVKEVNSAIESGDIDIPAGGTKLYKHTINDSDSGNTFILITTLSTPIDFTKWSSYYNVFEYLLTIDVISFTFNGDNIVYDGGTGEFCCILVVQGVFTSFRLDDWSLGDTTDVVTDL